MRGILGDRFLRRFAGNLKHRLKHLDSTGEGQNPEAEGSVAPETDAAEPDIHTSAEDPEEAGDAAEAD